jgi:hypothetical protein
MSIAAFRQQAMEKIKENASAGAQVPEGWPERFFYDSDTAHFFTPLHGWDLHIPLILHTQQVGKRYVTRICNGMFGADCKDCNNGIDKSNVFALLGYVHTLAGVTKEIKSGKRAGEEIELNPFKVIEIRGGRKQANLTEITDADRGGYFTKKVWQLKKTGSGTDTTYLPPMPAQLEKLGDNFDATIPPDVLDMLVPPKGLTQEQLISAYIVANYGNNEEALKVLNVPSIEEVEKLLGTKPKKAANPSAKLK